MPIQVQITNQVFLPARINPGVIPPPVETFYILTEDLKIITAENMDRLEKEH